MKSKTNKVISTIVLIILISIMIFSGMKIYKWLKENRQNSNIRKEISNSVIIDENIDTIDKYSIDFVNLKQTNPDTIAWVKVKGTEIEYPIVKAKNNEYYLTHSFDKSYNTAGWIFMDYKNKLDGTDKNIVIYGHNRKNGSMFASLKNVLTKEWQEIQENHKIPFITENEKAEYQVFSVYKIEDEDYYITTEFKNETEFQTFINKIKSRSVKDFGVEVNTEDQILTLSTCADNNNYRVVLHAKKIIEERSE